MSERWQNIGNDERKLNKRISRIRYFVSAICGIFGVLLLVSQLVPLSVSYAKGQIFKWKESILVVPVPQEFKDEHFKEFGYDPGESYFKNLIASAGLDYSDTATYDPTTKKMRDVVIDYSYTAPMQISIASIEINSVRLLPNIESQNANVYNQALKGGVAHFKGTPLPGDGGNSFIYGHSSVSSFFNINRNNPEIIFSKLENAEVGQAVIIHRDGIDLRYTIRSKKIVGPSDLSILQPTSDKETVTLMTCWPLGIGTQRLILIAERNE
jgi:LPXTG-site transpeptidase (sortase) family protein